MNEIQRYNYWEHVKAEKDLAFVLPPTDPKRVRIHKAANLMLEEQEAQVSDTTKPNIEQEDDKQISHKQ